MSKPATLDRNIMELLTDSDAGNPEDKMRLFIIFYICSHSTSEVWTLCFIITYIRACVVRVKSVGTQGDKW
jgi:hypothetical protein